MLFLILAFFNGAGLFVLVGAEFLAMVVVVVYVGAVAVLFLFVVMMLDINFVRLREGFLQYLPIGALIGLVLLVELVLALGTLALSPSEIAAAAQQPVPPDTTNTEALGTVFNTAVGERADLNRLVALLKKFLSAYDAEIAEVQVKYGNERAGDIPHSLASIERAKRLLQYKPTHNLEQGLAEAVNWYWKSFR